MIMSNANRFLFAGGLFALVAAVILYSATSACEKEKKNDEPLNIIFLFADDMRWDALGYTGNRISRTPAIDSLAERGAKFSRAYVTTSICSVSRASVLSGQYARRHGKWGFGPGFGADEWHLTYPKHLRDAGYRTGFIGKYGVGEYNYASQQFDYWRGFPGQGSFNATDESGDPTHLTRLMGDQALEFIETTETDTPFALSISFKAPHAENENIHWSLFDPAYSDQYEGAQFEQPLAAEALYFQHFPESFTQGNEARERYQARMGTPTLAQESLEGYYRLVYGIDRAVSRIVQKLEAAGLMDNTVIILSSDNGMYLGEYGFSGKWYGSDPSIHVPLLIFDPTQQQGSQHEEIALNIDIAPTILDYAGIEIPSSMQGRSLRPLVEGTATIPWRSDFLYEHLWNSGSGYYIPSTEGVVNDTAKYMRYFMNFDNSQLVFEELYRADENMHEINNLAGQGDAAALQQDLEARLQTLIEESE